MIGNILRKMWSFRPFRSPVSAPASPGQIDKELIRRFLPDTPAIVEAGAYVGTDTVEMSRMWPGGHIHAFEPVPHIYEQLRHETRSCHNVTCYPLALAGNTGSAEMRLSGGASEQSSSLLEPRQHLEQHPLVTFDRRLMVETITLDDWSSRCGHERVDFLWLDLQGCELAALKAAVKMLGTVRAIHTEVSLKETFAGAPLYAEVRGWLQPHGFRVEWEGLYWPDAGNVLFVRE